MLLAFVILLQLVCRPFADAQAGAPTVNNLAVRITTRDLRGAGTDNSVYFDVGPWSWRLNNFWRNDFERSRTDTFNLKVPEGFALSDILWLRLHKKGLLGVTGTRDGLTGAWHPDRITLLVNGVDCASEEVPDALNSRRWFWRKTDDFDPYADPASFIRALRLKPNDALPWFAKATGFFTTPLFKRRNISGWLDCPEQKQNLRIDKPCAAVPKFVCATGKVHRRPGVSNDGLATIDLELDVFEFCSDTAACYKHADVQTADTSARLRYLRVEYEYKNKGIPKAGDRVRICGKLRWDTDREGWWEIRTSEIKVLGR